MADPHIKSPMDVWDYVTVIIYRSGFTLAVPMLLMLPWYPATAQIGLLIAAASCAACVHLYMKNFRYLFQFAMWLGLLCQILGFPQLALGAAFLVLGGLSYKEYFCFRVFALNLQPIFFAILWFALLFDLTWLSTLLSLVTGILILLLSIQKWRMPLHFDIGDKRKYQV
ncbi:hypothetical protein HYE54_03045 [Aggregatibacter actinomycetemcomitans]|uniref:DUF2301 domain-containing membrane protein n=1 Tax=Aggregatibacter actinomycetemcomitans TaxID=714 RepID=UPI00197BC031|nr:DUF2301 domain-containing membrane protein [Aggregatibacter actinomycetemcomitans]MBN6067767.1 hypothetical protein [Aggregatibacter actinomycetemcomitans]MBN6085704.1 hypothetical protein [Aggregatibacter actinomycetemcomitans]